MFQTTFGLVSNNEIVVFGRHVPLERALDLRLPRTARTEEGGLLATRVAQMADKVALVLVRAPARAAVMLQLCQIYYY